MKAWAQAATVRERLERQWERGRILAHLVGETSLFPYRIPLAGPTTQDLVDHYSAVREWIQELLPLQTTEVTLGWRDFKHPQLGKNRIPIAITMETPEAALHLLGRTEDARRVVQALHLTAERIPDLQAWVRHHPLQVLEWSDVWPRLLTVVQWVLDHPRSGLYLRQVDAFGIDTKFIERHRRILTDLLDQLVHPSAASSGFEARYGFRQKPQLVRLRFLDPARNLQGLTDLTVPSEEFRGLQLCVQRVFMMENEIEFLAFPALPDSLAVFGAGYGLSRFAGVNWLLSVSTYYWGDIDTHGLAILDELRLYLPHAQSLLMDEETLLAHRTFWDREERPATRDLTRLTSLESDLYQGLQSQRWGRGVRLEQERIPLRYLVDRLIAMGMVQR